MIKKKLSQKTTNFNLRNQQGARRCNNQGFDMSIKVLKLNSKRKKWKNKNANFLKLYMWLRQTASYKKLHTLHLSFTVTYNFSKNKIRSWILYKFFPSQNEWNVCMYTRKIWGEGGVTAEKIFSHRIEFNKFYSLLRIMK